ncbi:MAG: hypothetical protein R2911_42260 [Caldilineaceae bacterium]
MLAAELTAANLLNQIDRLGFRLGIQFIPQQLPKFGVLGQCLIGQTAMGQQA